MTRRRVSARRKRPSGPFARLLVAMRSMSRVTRAVLLIGLVLLVLLAVLLVRACGGGGEGSKKGNLFANPGFENGKDPWYSMETSGWGTPFEVSDAAAHSGQYSAHLALRPPSQAVQHQVFGAVQSLFNPKAFPEFLSGFYRVENWQKGTKFQYLQFVVIAILPGDAGNIQIRYLLAGTDTDPFRIDNAKFVYLSKEEPKIGEWVHFERNVADDFRQLWGQVPDKVQELRIFFEVRYDFDTPSTGNMNGDVYYDDLYVGSKAEAPAYP
jgi:hypothetical protein